MKITPRTKWIPASKLPEEYFLEVIFFGGNYTVAEGFYVKKLKDDSLLETGFYISGGGNLYPCPWVEWYIAKPEIPK